MLYKSLILGVLFSIGIFAAKSGVGVAYVVGQKRNKKAVALAVLLFSMAYGLVFGLTALVLPHIDPVRHLAAVQSFIQSGMVVHLVMAGLMMGWGVLLLKQTDTAASKSRGWLMLVLPCPVCATVILFSSAFLITCFPDHPKVVMLVLYLAFVLISLATTGVIHRYHQPSGGSSESFLGAAMLFIAAYFFVSVTVMPQFSDLDKVYRMAHYHADVPSRDVLSIAAYVLFSAAAFGLGYGLKFKKIRSLT